jgi:hypothetical protein
MSIGKLVVGRGWTGGAGSSFGLQNHTPIKGMLAHLTVDLLSGITVHFLLFASGCSKTVTFFLRVLLNLVGLLCDL